MSVITLERKVLEKNDEVAALNRNLFSARHIHSLNLISSPGSGKTSIVEQIIKNLRQEINIAVIEGDCQTDLDARRIDRLEVPVVQIVTQGGCHLDSMLVRDAFSKFDSSSIDLLIIENVGNLVCPAAYDLGESAKMVILSSTEGEDKPLKYPAVFIRSDVLIINKTDLLPHLSFSIDILCENALNINPLLNIFKVSCYSGDGIPELCKFIKESLIK
jgi:hydrogenase nickel incorporation protein HypB